MTTIVLALVHGAAVWTPCLVVAGGILAAGSAARRWLPLALVGACASDASFKTAPEPEPASLEAVLQAECAPLFDEVCDDGITQCYGCTLPEGPAYVCDDGFEVLVQGERGGHNEVVCHCYGERLEAEVPGACGPVDSGLGWEG